MKRIVAYTRVSTQEQAQHGISLEAQRARAEQFCLLYGHELVAVIEDAGQSAKDLRRPGLQRALAMLEAGEADGLLVAKLDRLTRSVKDLAALLESHFVGRFTLHSVQEMLDTGSAAGRMVLNILGALAEFERAQVSERTKAALAYKASKGEVLGAPPLGYRIVDGVLEEIPEELATVQRIQELRAEGLVLRDVAAVLTKEGHKTKRGGDWHPQSVARVLKRLEA
jgi:DNA invertase Pin-like site-specific DNA recombinase